jgi:hypothetical protein
MMRTVLRRLVLVLALSPATPVTAQGDAPIAADRPGIADSAATIERGRIQLEVGTQWESRPDEITIFVPALVRVGLWDRFEMRIEGNTFSVADAEGDYRSGLSPTSAGFKWSVNPAEGRRPGVGVIARVFPRWGLGGFEAGRATADARLAADWEFGHGFSLNPNAGIGWYDDDGEGFVAGLFAVTLGYQQGAVYWFVDAALQAPEADGGATAVVADGGLGWVPRPNLQLDVSAGSRLRGETPPRLFIAVGLSYRVRGWGRE